MRGCYLYWADQRCISNDAPTSSCPPGTERQKKWKDSCATQLAAEQWGAHTAKEPSAGGGSEGNLPIWRLTGAAIIPADSRQMGVKHGQVLGSAVAALLVIYQLQPALFVFREFNHGMKPASNAGCGLQKIHFARL